MAEVLHLRIDDAFARGLDILRDQHDINISAYVRGALLERIQSEYPEVAAIIAKAAPDGH